LRPEDFGAFVHGGAVLIAEGEGGVAGVGVVGINVDGLPLFPKGRVGGPGIDGAEDAAGPSGSVVEF